MKLIDYSKEKEKKKKQNGWTGAEWLWAYELFTPMIMWPAGSCGTVAAQHHKRVSRANH